MQNITITDLKQIDNLVAEHLGYLKYTWEEECSQYNVGAQWNYGGEYYYVTMYSWVPENLYNRTEEEWLANYYYKKEEEKELADYYPSLEDFIHSQNMYGAPPFSLDWETIQTLIDSLTPSCHITFSANRWSTECTIKNLYDDNNIVNVSTGDLSTEYKIKSLPLAISLAFLKLKDIRIILNLT